MKAYLISIRDMSLLDQWDASAYTLYPDSDTAGQLTIRSDRDVNAGNWILFDQRLWITDSAKPSEGVVQLKVRDPLYAFDRKLKYTGTSQTTVEGFIASCLESEYKLLSDPAYAMPYLTVSSTGTTTFVEPELGSGDVFSLSDYGEAARASGINIRFSYENDHIAVRIYPSSAEKKIIVMDDGHYQLKSEIYSRETVAKVTVRQKEELQDESVTYHDVDYYLSSDGTIGTSVPANRAEGKWEIIVTRYGDDDPLAKAQAVFAQNENSHKIEYWSDQEMENYTPVRIRFKRGLLFETRITKVKITSDDNRVLYTCGNLPTTLTDIVNNKEEKKA